MPSVFLTNKHTGGNTCDCSASPDAMMIKTSAGVSGPGWHEVTASFFPPNILSLGLWLGGQF